MSLKPFLNPDGDHSNDYRHAVASTSIAFGRATFGSDDVWDFGFGLNFEQTLLDSPGLGV